MVDIEQLELQYFQTNKPVPYDLKCGVQLLIEPIRVEHWAEFERALPVLKIEKNDINDVEIIQMSYVAFLEFLSMSNQMYFNMLKTLLRHSLRMENFGFGKDGGKVCICETDRPEDDDDAEITTIITAKEFDEIKKIILFQNIYDYDDTYLSADVRKAIEEYNKIRYKDVVSPTLEKKKIFIMSKNGASENRINKMYYRTFSQLFKTLVDNDIYFANKMLEASQKYETKEISTHPMFVKDIDKINDAFSSMSNIENKMGSVT